jgi:hypothetical protein
MSDRLEASQSRTQRASISKHVDRVLWPQLGESQYFIVPSANTERSTRHIYSEAVGEKTEGRKDFLNRRTQRFFQCSLLNDCEHFKIKRIKDLKGEHFRSQFFEAFESSDIPVAAPPFVLMAGRLPGVGRNSPALSRY